MKIFLLLIFLPSFTFGLNQKNPHIPFFKQIKIKHLYQSELKIPTLVLSSRGRLDSHFRGNPAIKLKNSNTIGISLSLSQQSSVNYLKSMRQSPLKKQFLTENKTNPLVVLYEKTIPTTKTQTSTSHDILTQAKTKTIKSEKNKPAQSSVQNLINTQTQMKTPVKASNSNNNIIPISRKNLNTKDKTNQASVKNSNTEVALTQDKKVKPSTLNHVTLKTSTEKNTSFILFKLNNEIRLSQNKVSRNQKKTYPSIPYTALSLDYSQLPLNFFMEWEFFPQNEQIIRVSEINLSYTFKSFPIQLQTGWLPLPLGYWPEHTNLFLRDLSLHQALAENGEDVGMTLQADLWKKHLYLQVSGFGGYVKREEEDFYRAPDFSPLIVSLKTQNSVGKGFVTWFKKDLALFDPLQAMGGGLHFKHSFKNLKVSIQGELWLMDEKNQTTFSYYVFPEIKWNKWKAGIVLGDINRFFPHIKKSTARISLYERAFQISWNIHPYITLTAEKFLTKQRKGPFLNDLWAVRLQTQFKF